MAAAANLTGLPGTYALILRAHSWQTVQIGKCGSLKVEPGCYLYVGSAFGPGGIAARVAHHQREAHRPHWHIDYLRRVLPLTEYWFSFDPCHREHQWAEVAGGLRGASIPLARFGASDCSCPSHLFHFSRPPAFESFRRQVMSMVPEHTELRRLRE